MFHLHRIQRKIKASIQYTINVELCNFCCKLCAFVLIFREARERKKKFKEERYSYVCVYEPAKMYVKFKNILKKILVFIVDFYCCLPKALPLGISSLAKASVLTASFSDALNMIFARSLFPQY